MVNHETRTRSHRCFGLTVGSMPYAQWHYPFENKDKFKTSYPADYIAEGVGSDTGWFLPIYCSNVL